MTGDWKNKLYFGDNLNILRDYGLVAKKYLRQVN